MATDEAYEAAAVAFRLGDPLAPPWPGTALWERISIVVDAVWDLAIVESRREALKIAARGLLADAKAHAAKWNTEKWDQGFVAGMEHAAHTIANSVDRIDPDQDVWNYLDGEVNDAAAS